MLLRDAQRLAALRDIQRFLDAPGATFASYNAGGSRRSLDGVIARLAALAREDEAHRIGALGAREQELRLADDLRRKYFRPIVDIQAQRPDELAGLGAIRFPWRRTNSTKLVTMARAVARVVRPRAEVFIAVGLKADFLARMRADAEALKAAVIAKGAHRSGRRKAARAIEQTVAQARRAVRVADAFVLEAVEPDSPLVAEWRQLCRAFRRPARRSAASRVTE